MEVVVMVANIRRGSLNLAGEEGAEEEGEEKEGELGMEEEVEEDEEEGVDEDEKGKGEGERKGEGEGARTGKGEDSRSTVPLSGNAVAFICVAFEHTIQGCDCIKGNTNTCNAFVDNFIFQVL